MFKLILIVTVLASQIEAPFEHVRSPFPSQEACQAAIEKTRESTIAFFEAQLGPVQTDFQCVPVEPSSESDRAADGIRRILRIMTSQGGFGGGAQHGGDK